MKRDPTKRMLALARQLDRRECFADSIDGLNAHVIFGMLLDEREAAQPPAVDEATAQLTPPKDADEDMPDDHFLGSILLDIANGDIPLDEVREYARVNHAKVFEAKERG